MRRRTMIIGVVGAVLLCGIAIAGEEVKIALQDAPAKVQEALTKLAGNATITKVEREEKRGAMCYEGEWESNGSEMEAKVTADGDLMKLEQKLAAKDVPAAVKEAAAKMFPGDTNIEYKKVTMIAYEVEAKVEGNKKEVHIDPMGNMMHHEMKGKHHEGYKNKDDDDGDGK
jgi:uncharacterized membrane protein YkoI